MSVLTIRSRSQSADKSLFDESFVSLPHRVRAPEFRSGIMSANLERLLIARPLGPFELFLAEQGGGVVGRIGANVSTLSGEIGYVGFLEIDLTQPDSSAIALELYRAAEGWLRAHGVETTYGPINFSTWFPYRYRDDEDPSPSRSWEPSNPHAYVEMILAAGFVADSQYYSVGLSEVQTFIGAMKRGYDRSLAHGITYRPMENKITRARDIGALYSITLRSYAQNFLFEPISFEAFRSIYALGADRNYDGSFFACDASGEEVGFMICFGHEGEFILKTIAVLPEQQGKAIGRGVLYPCASRAVELGYGTVVSALVRGGASSEFATKETPIAWTHRYSLFRKAM